MPEVKATARYMIEDVRAAHVLHKFFGFRCPEPFPLSQPFARYHEAVNRRVVGLSPTLQTRHWLWKKDTTEIGADTIRSQ